MWRTDGSVDPESAIRNAAELVRKSLEYMLYFGEGGIPQVAPPGAHTGSGASPGLSSTVPSKIWPS